MNEQTVQSLLFLAMVGAMVVLSLLDSFVRRQQRRRQMEQMEEEERRGGVSLERADAEAEAVEPGTWISPEEYDLWEEDAPRSPELPEPWTRPEPAEAGGWDEPPRREPARPEGRRETPRREHTGRDRSEAARREPARARGTSEAPRGEPTRTGGRSEAAGREPARTGSRSEAARREPARAGAGSEAPPTDLSAEAQRLRQESRREIEEAARTPLIEEVETTSPAFPSTGGRRRKIQAPALRRAMGGDVQALRDAVLYREILGRPLGSRPGPGGWEDSAG